MDKKTRAGSLLESAATEGLELRGQHTARIPNAEGTYTLTLEVRTDESRLILALRGEPLALLPVFENEPAGLKKAVRDFELRTGKILDSVQRHNMLVSEKTLDKAARDKLKDSDFALPKERKYPIPDIEHARDALSYVSRYGTDDQKSQVKAAVHRKFPEIDKDKKGEAADPEMIDTDDQAMAMVKHGRQPAGECTACYLASDGGWYVEVKKSEESTEARGPFNSEEEAHQNLVDGSIDMPSTLKCDDSGKKSPPKDARAAKQFRSAPAVKDDTNKGFKDGSNNMDPPALEARHIMSNKAQVFNKKK